MKFFLWFFSILFGGSLLSLCILLLGCAPEYKLVFKNAQIKVLDIAHLSADVQNQQFIKYTDFNFQVDFGVQIVNRMAYVNVGNSVYAFSQEDPQNKLFEKIKDIKLISIQNYNSNIFANADCSASCEWILFSQSVGRNNFDKASLINTLNDSFYGSYKNDKISLSVKFKEVPNDTILDQQFIIDIETELGNHFRDTSVIFNIYP